ncbi:hypothetical protein HD806DRAFT_501471 [Xylariaceae sp. AK1471]|nr:hypothetical protein HD806DRAFT_501471 [Xylariaceae sp. AK1471]
MTSQQNMPEHSDAHLRSTSTLREQGWAPTRRQQHYPPPQAVNQYASRALPAPPSLAPPRPQSSSSSIYDSEEAPSRQPTPQHLLIVSQAKDGRKSTTFGGAIDEAAFAMVRPPQIKIPHRSQSYGHLDVVSPQPQHPDSKLISMWADGDDLVSPINTPGTANWKNYVVSPLSESSESGTTSEPDRAFFMESDSWAEDSTSDQAERRYSLSWAQKNNQSGDAAIPGASHIQVPKMNLRYSDPGSPLIYGLDSSGFGEPGPDVGPDVGPSRRFDNASGRQTPLTEAYTQSMYSVDRRNRPQDKKLFIEDTNVSFAVPKIDTFSSNSPAASHRPAPSPPLNLSERPVQEEYIRTPFPLRTISDLSQKGVFETNEPSVKQQKRRSGLANFGTSLRSSVEKSKKSPPGFTEILSQLDHQGQGRVSPVPKVKNILSKAKQGLGIGLSDESKKEKRREELKRQIRMGNAE